MNPAQAQSDISPSTETVGLAQKLPPLGTFPTAQPTQANPISTPSLNSVPNMTPQTPITQTPQQQSTAINFDSIFTNAPSQTSIQQPQSPLPAENFQITDVQVSPSESGLQSASSMAIPTGPTLGLPPIPSVYSDSLPIITSTQENINSEEVKHDVNHEVELATPQQILQEAQDTLNLPLAQNNPDLHAAVIKAAEEALSEVFKKNKT